MWYPVTAILFLLPIGISLWVSSGQNNTISRQELETLLDETRRRHQFEPGANADVPGFTYLLMIMLHDTGNEQNQVIFESNQATMYLTGQGALACRTTNTDGISYVVEVVEAPNYQLYLEKLAILGCTVGLFESESYIEIRVNGVALNRVGIPTKLTLPDLHAMSLGARLNGQDGSRMDLAETRVYNRAFSKNDFVLLLSYWKSEHIQAYLEFDEDDFMLRDNNGELRQLEKAHRPRRRQLDPYGDNVPVDVLPDYRSLRDQIYHANPLSLENEGHITFWIRHEHRDWSTNSAGYNLGQIAEPGISVDAKKHPDKTVELKVLGPFGHHFTFRTQIPPSDEHGLFVAITWKDRNVHLYLNGQRVETLHASE